MKFKKWFLLVSILTITLLLLLGNLVYLSTTQNLLYQQGQQRIKEITSNKDAEIVFLGDSSLANAINNTLFEQLSNKKVLNLWLTGGGHNLASTYNLLRHILKEKKKIQTIIIMHTPSVYGYDFLLGGYFSTLGNLDSDTARKNELLGYKDFLAFYVLNLPGIKEYFTMKQVEKNQQSTEPWTFKNEKLTRPVNQLQREYLKIGISKKTELKMIDDLVKDKNITVVYIQGPLHHDVSTKYQDIIKQQQSLIKKTFKNITFIESYTYPENKHMGNTIDHVDKSYKDTVTKLYYERLKQYL